jgi:hypothetical protein
MDDGPESLATESVLSRYLEASKVQQQQMRGVTMDVHMTAELPKMKKSGHMQALRTISRIGRITYDAIRFQGDNTIKKEVIARFLSTEVESTDKTAPPITPEFYKFKYKGLTEREGTPVHVLQLTPKKKQAGTFKGELWLDPETYLPVREAGRLAKNPSIFIKRFDFVRQYEVRDGMAVPVHTTGTVETRLWGKAEMAIDYTNFTRAPETATLPLSESDLANRP